MRSWIRRPLGAVLVAAAIGAGAIGTVITTSSDPYEPPVGAGCDQTLTTRAEVNTALTNTSSSGQTLCVNTDLTGTAITTSTDMTSEARLVAQPMDGSISMVDFTCNGCSNITLDGFEWTGNAGVMVSGTAATNFKYVRNYCHDQQQTCIEASGSTHNGTKILANRFSDLECPTGQPTAACETPNSLGYGVNWSADQDNFEFSWNECDAASGVRTADCIELAEVDGAEIVGNYFHDMPNAGGPHGDSIMVWSNSEDVLVKDNRSIDTLGTLMSPDTDRLTMQNNLIARAGIRCVDADANGTSGEIQPLDWNIDNNTIVNCGFEAWHQGGLSTTGRGSNIYTDNIFQREVGGTNVDFRDNFGATPCISATFETFSGNVLESPATQAGDCGWNTSTNTFSRTTTWQNTVDYLPTNLPVGFENAGYRLAPNGPSACGVDDGCAADPSDSGGELAVECDSSISTYAALNTALTSTSSSGNTICVTADITGAKINTTTAMTSEAQFVAQPADGSILIPRLSFNTGASNITIYGFELTEGDNTDFSIGMGNPSNIHFIKNNCHDQLANCFEPGGTNTWLLGNTMKYISYDGGFPHGNGVYGGSSEFGTGAKLNYNFCDGGGGTLSQPMSDCMELTGLVNFEIIGNVIQNVEGTCCGGHSDGISLADGSTTGTVKDNRIDNGFETLFSPHIDNLTFDNNLITNYFQCVSAQGAGDADPAIQPDNWTITNNTLWGCGASGGWNMTGQDGSGTDGSSNQMTNNLFEKLGCVGRTITDGNTGNVLGPASTCLPGTGNSHSFTSPTWENSSDPNDPGYFIPTNLPGGFTSAGYRYAPAGPDACGFAEGCIYG